MNKGEVVAMQVEEGDYAKLRKDVRVRAAINVRFSLLNAAEFQSEQELLESRASSFHTYYRWLTQQPTFAGAKDMDEMGAKLLHLLFDLQGRVNRVLQIVERQAQGGSGLMSGRTIDVSAGGFRIGTAQKLNVGDRLKVSLEVPVVHGIDIPALCEIKTLEAVENEGKTAYFAGLQFVFIIEEDRDLLVRYIFQRQRDTLRRRRLGGE